MAKMAENLMFSGMQRILRSNVSKLRVQLKRAEDLYHPNDQIAKFNARIANIRQLNYRSQINLEADQLKVSQLCASIEPSQKEKFEKEAAAIRMEISAINDEIGFADVDAKEGKPGSLSPLNKRADALKTRIEDFSNRIQQSMALLLSCLAMLGQSLSAAENAVNLTSMASFQWQEDETPIFALMAKDMDKKIEVILTLTNQRIICESVMKVALERPSKHDLYLTVKKERERKLLLERPVGSVDKITKGGVGLLAGEGLRIEFKQSSDPKLKLGNISSINNSRKEDADLAIRYFNMITSGQIDDELKQSSLQRKSVERVTSCSKCGAPFTDGVYRRPLKSLGIMRVAGGRPTCKYCGTVIEAPVLLSTNMERDARGAWCVCPQCGKYISADVEVCTCGAKLPARVKQTCDVCGNFISDIWNKVLCPEEHIVCTKCSGTIALQCQLCKKPLVF